MYMQKLSYQIVVLANPSVGLPNTKYTYLFLRLFVAYCITFGFYLDISKHRKIIHFYLISLHCVIFFTDKMNSMVFFITKVNEIFGIVFLNSFLGGIMQRHSSTKKKYWFLCYIINPYNEPIFSRVRLFTRSIVMNSNEK